MEGYIRAKEIGKRLDYLGDGPKGGWCERMEVEEFVSLGSWLRFKILCWCCCLVVEGEGREQERYKSPRPRLADLSIATLTNATWFPRAAEQRVSHRFFTYTLHFL